jgi:hypothetical protein
MIKTIRDDKIDWLVNLIISDEELLSLDPVFAGGSMLSVYRAFRLHDSEHKWQDFKRSLLNNRSSQKRSKLDPFGDIDVWFKEGGVIHSGGHRLCWLTKDFSKSSLTSMVSATETTHADKHFPGELAKSSKWANTFKRKHKHAGNIPGGVGAIQIIKKPISSIEDLFKDFDFINCCVAYSDGALYYDSRLDRAFEDFELKFNNDSAYKSNSIAKRVFSGLRAFKYAKRFSLDFSQDLSDTIFKLYVDSRCINYSDYKERVIMINDHYGQQITTVNDLKNMVNKLNREFAEFSQMKFFKKEYALWLIDRKELSGLGEVLGVKDLMGEGSHFAPIPF